MIYRAIINSFGVERASTYLTFDAASLKVADMAVALLGIQGCAFSPEVTGQPTTLPAGMLRRPDGVRDSSVLLTAMQRAMKSRDVMFALWSLAPVPGTERKAYFDRVGFLTQHHNTTEAVYHRSFAVWMEMNLPPDIIITMTRAHVLAAEIAANVGALMLVEKPPVEHRQYEPVRD